MYDANENDKSSMGRENADAPLVTNVESESKRKDLETTLSPKAENIGGLSTTLQQKQLDLTKEWEGVATTLLIGSPKWFSRRFSIMFHNMLAAIPSTWAVQIFVTGEGISKEGIDINIGLRRLISSLDRVFVTVIPKEKVTANKKRRFLYLTDSWFWESIMAEKVLLFGGNGAFCGNSLSTINDFVQYDYIGLPWGSHRGVGGGGEFSIRSKSAMLEALKYNPYNGKDRDDDYFVKTLLQMNQQNLKNTDVSSQKQYQIASKEATQKFAGTDAFVKDYETHKEKKSWEIVGPPFLIQGTLPRLEHEVREAFLMLCPELKVIFPVLHSPHCFGAHPNSEKCAETICALQPHKRGGC